MSSEFVGVPTAEPWMARSPLMSCNGPAPDRGDLIAKFIPKLDSEVAEAADALERPASGSPKSGKSKGGLADYLSLFPPPVAT